jgi:hypothetical protein
VELDTLLAEAASGGGSPMLDRQTLVQLLGFAQARDYVIDAMEVFELKDGLEYPRVEFGLYGGDLVAETSGMSFDQSMAHILNAVDVVLSAVDETDAHHGFLIWLAKVQAWRDAAQTT